MNNSIWHDKIMIIANMRYIRLKNHANIFRKKEKKYALLFGSGEIERDEYLSCINNLLEKDMKSPISVNYINPDAIRNVDTETEVKRDHIKTRSESKLLYMIKTGCDLINELDELRSLNSSLQELLHSGDVTIDGYLDKVNAFLKNLDIEPINYNNRIIEPGKRNFLKPGDAIGDLIVLQKMISRKRRAYWNCLCVLCGNTNVYHTDRIYTGGNCGCEERKRLERRKLEKEEDNQKKIRRSFT